MFSHAYISIKLQSCDLSYKYLNEICCILSRKIDDCLTTSCIHPWELRCYHDASCMLPGVLRW